MSDDTPPPWPLVGRAARLADLLFLEDIVALSRCSRQLHAAYKSPPAPARSRVRPASRERFWAHASRAEPNRRRVISKAEPSVWKACLDARRGASSKHG